MIKTIIKWTFAVGLVLLLLTSALLQLFRPEWFLLQESNKANFVLNTNMEINKSIAPYRVCSYSGCSYKNVPYDEPYVTKTKWAWLYNYQTEMLILILLIGILLNYDKVKGWISTFSN